ncbi:MAG: hypothetical protein HY247_00630 [archaeon]|nr:MAG: hypothetical protein HY247_00630 [archaeon]
MDFRLEVSSLLSSGSRVIIIAEKDVDLRSSAVDNRMFFLAIADGSLAGGGRGGGFGERKVARVSAYAGVAGSWSKLYDTEDGEKASLFEIPYYVSRIPITLADGAESMGYGVVEPELVKKMSDLAGIGSPP